MKFLKWIGAIFVFLGGMFALSRARRNSQRAETLTGKQVKELSKDKQANLAKAAALGDKADAKLDKAIAANKTTKDRIKKLEDSNAKTLADRMRRFNDGL